MHNEADQSMDHVLKQLAPYTESAHFSHEVTQNESGTNIHVFYKDLMRSEEGVPEGETSIEVEYDKEGNLKSCTFMGAGDTIPIVYEVTEEMRSQVIDKIYGPYASQIEDPEGIYPQGLLRLNDEAFVELRFENTFRREDVDKYSLVGFYSPVANLVETEERMNTEDNNKPFRIPITVDKATLSQMAEPGFKMAEFLTPRPRVSLS